MSTPPSDGVSLIERHCLTGRADVQRELDTLGEGPRQAMVKKYLVASEAEKGVWVRYHRPLNGDLGRYTASPAQGLPCCFMRGMGRKVRAALIGSGYHDVDMVNAHPVLLKQVCVCVRVCDQMQMQMSFVCHFTLCRWRREWAHLMH